MSVQRLGTYIEQYSQKNKNDEPYPVYSVTNSEGFCTEYFNKDVSGKNKTNYKIVPKGYFAYNPSRINVGSIDWQNSEDNVIVSPIYVVFKCLNGLNQDYLKYFIKSSEGIRMINSKVSGAVRNNLRFEDLSEFEFNIVDYDKQLEVVNTLRLIEKAIKNEKHQLELLDEFIKARFVELFGDLNVNPKGWELKSFDELTNLITDGEHSTPRRCEEGIYLLSARNVLNHELQLEDVDYIDDEEYERISKRIIPQSGDVLLSCSGTVGRCCCVPEGLKFQMVRSTALLRFKEELNPVFAEYMITSDFVQKQIDKAKTASSQANLFQGKIAKLRGFVPPRELQDEFLVFAKQVDKSKVVVQERLEKYEELLEKKLYEYFIV